MSDAPKLPPGWESDFPGDYFDRRSCVGITVDEDGCVEWVSPGVTPAPTIDEVIAVLEYHRWRSRPPQEVT